MNTDMSAKALLRRELLAARRLLTDQDVERAAAVLARHALALPP
ncbi:5-formyltetrahydrofolate cyclo-ligase, partial [Streptomyces sp. SID7803]|nr:5-formyltetrahydrofolate cyclo-ligase [Streptomyces sp. SID7803]